jgi:putative colanic acid biosynthesis acetyltransferase WcaF
MWIVFSFIFFETVIPYPNTWKSSILRLFGAKIGKGVVLKPSVKIKQPWRLEIGDHSWIGEGVWIDNLVHVSLASNVCLSQGAFLLTGNHNYKKTSFDLITGEIHLEEGVWIGAKSIVGPGVTCYSHAVLAAGSCAFKNLDAYSVYQGNPAIFMRLRDCK